MRLQDWYETYKEHHAWSSIQDSVEIATDLLGDDAEQQEMLDYIRLVLASALKLRDAPTIMVSKTMLDELDAGASEVLRRLTNWSNTSNIV